MKVNSKSGSDSNSGIRSNRLTLAMVGALFACTAATAQADPTASANAYDLNVDISLLVLPLLAIHNHDQVQFSNSALAQSFVTIGVPFDSGTPAGTLARLQTDTMKDEVLWAPGDFMSLGAESTVNNLRLNVGAISYTAPGLISLSSTLIRSTSIITGSCPAPTGVAHFALAGPTDIGDTIMLNGFEQPGLTPDMSATDPGLTLTLLNNPQGPFLDATLNNPAPNTSLVLVNLGSVLTASVILNEQTVSGDGVTGLSVAGNGLHLVLNVLNSINADVKVAHTEASINCN